MSMKLYVGNLSFQTSSFDLEELFAGIGTVESASVVENRETGRSRGFGFVEMANQEDGEKAIAELNGTNFRAARSRSTKLSPAKIAVAAVIAGKLVLNTKIETPEALSFRAFPICALCVFTSCLCD